MSSILIPVLIPVWPPGDPGGKKSCLVIHQDLIKTKKMQKTT